MMRKTIQLWITVLVLTIGSSMALTSCSNEDHASHPASRACQVPQVVGPAVVGDAFAGGTFSSLVVDVGHIALEILENLSASPKVSSCEFQNLQKEFQNLQKFSLRAFFAVVFKKLCLSLQNNDNLKSLSIIINKV